jgi:Flp pilus assembly protein TadD
MSASPAAEHEIPFATRRRVRHAVGYIGLSMWRHAWAELKAIDAADRTLPLVRSATVDYHMGRRQWARVVTVARRLAREHPVVENAWIGWAYALRELQRIEEARRVLLGAEPHHRDSAVLHYNLACYESLLGDLPAARSRLDRACRIDAQFKEAAETDPDLAALRAHES